VHRPDLPWELTIVGTRVIDATRGGVPGRWALFLGLADAPDTEGAAESTAAVGAVLVAALETEVPVALTRAFEGRVLES